MLDSVITYNGNSSEDVGLKVERYPAIIKADRKHEKVSVPGRNGDIYFFQDAWNNYTQPYEVFAGDRAPAAAQAAWENIISWLCQQDDELTVDDFKNLTLHGYHRLIDSYEPDVIRLAAFASGVAAENSWNRFGRATIDFDCRPERFTADAFDWIDLSEESETYSGSIVSFEGSGAPMAGLKVDINPVQNLNGYSHPWSGGGGKNKLENTRANTTATVNGITFTAKADGTVVVNGTATANAPLIIQNSGTWTTLPSGTYTLSGCPSGGSGSKYALIAQFYDNGTAKILTDYGSGATATYSTGASLPSGSANIFIIVFNGTTVNNLTFKPMIESGSTATTFEPYENICPISGWDSVDVNVRGKNLLTNSPMDIGTFSGVAVSVNSSGQIVLNGTCTSNNVVRAGSCTLPSGHYIFSGMTSVGAPNTFFLNILPTASGTGNYNLYEGSYAMDTTEEYTFTVRVYFRSGQTFNNMVFEPMIRLASDTDATFAPYNANTTTVDLGQTVYGGSLNVTTGVLMITHERYAFTGNETITSSAYVGHTRFSCQALTNLADNNNNNNNYCSHFVPSTSPVGNNATDNAIAVYNRGLYWRADQFADVTAMKSYFSTQASGGTPVTYVAKLETPITVQLTPTQVNTLLGQNNVWADSGDVEVKLFPTLNNPTDRNAKPFLKVIGSGSGTVVLNGYVINITGMTDYLYIDCESQNCFRLLAENKNNLITLTNGFPELKPDENAVGWTGGVTKVEIVPRWWRL